MVTIWNMNWLTQEKEKGTAVHHDGSQSAKHQTSLLKLHKFALHPKAVFTGFETDAKHNANSLTRDAKA